jgi:hypothetical protein
VGEHLKCVWQCPHCGAWLTAGAEAWEVKSEESVRTEDFCSDAGPALRLLEAEELFGEEELAIMAEAEAVAGVCTTVGQRGRHGLGCNGLHIFSNEIKEYY